MLTDHILGRHFDEYLGQGDHYRQVIHMAQNRDYVGNQVGGEEKVSQRQEGQQLQIDRHGRITHQPVD